MTIKTNVASALRQLGLASIVESHAFRRRVGAPIYTKKQDIQPPSKSTHSFGPGPKLAVVVPSYNVAQYLPSCLDSILAQTYKNLDIIVVNDGSTDQTASVADSYAHKHKRVRVIHQQNAGLGAARNTGLQNSDADFITFVDSDDTLPPNAYEVAMRSLLSTGSDVSVGAVSRFDSRNRWLPFWVQLAHDQDRPGITGLDFPPIMWDVFAWNKVYRRSTWDRLVGSFPVGTLYEDQECTAKLYVGGAKIDVLKEVVYNWRLRDDNTSITQQKTSIDDLRQRLDVARTVRGIIEGSNAEYLDYWYSKTLGEDMYYYLREVPRASSDFFNLLSARISEFWNEASAEAIARINPDRRLLCYFAATGNRSDLESLLVQLERSKNSFAGVFSEGEYDFSIARDDGTEFEVPTAIKGARPQHFKSYASIETFNSIDNGDVLITGHAFLRNLESQYGLSADLFDSVDNQVVSTLEITSAPVPATYKLSDFYHSYGNSGFQLTIPHYVIDDIGSRMEGSQSSNLRLRIHIHLGGDTWTVDTVKRNLHSAAGYPSASYHTSRGHRLAVQGDPRLHTDIVVLKPRLRAVDISIDCDELAVEFDAGVLDSSFRGASPSGLNLVLSCDGNVLTRSRFGTKPTTTAFARLALPQNHIRSSQRIDSYELYVEAPSGLRQAIAIERDRTSRRRDQDFILGMTGFGYAKIERPLQAATADKLELSQNGRVLTVQGTYALDPRVARSTAPTLALVGPHRNIYPESVAFSAKDRTFDAHFLLEEPDGEGGHRPLEASEFILQLLLATGKAHPASSWVQTSVALEFSLPLQRQTPSHLVTADPVGTSRSLRITLAPSLDPATELGRRNEALNSTVFRSGRKPIRSKTVLFESFGGVSVADSPLALDAEISRRFPEITRFWTVKNPAVKVPDGVIPVVAGSRAWFDAVSRSKVLVNNNNFPYFFRKHPDQFHIQTWHGTPLKRIGNHVPATNLSLNYRALMRREASCSWNVLLAQSPWAADVLRDAFDFNGEVLSHGYPRNDLLADDLRYSEVRNRVRRRFGLNDGQRVVLYAPTWRDNLKESSGHYSRVDFLGVDSAAKALGASTTILYRGHSNSLNAKAKRFPASVIDVSLHPDVNDLIAASDLLVTDYSSIMFDYVVTGKPIVFLCPDLDEYRDSIRGFYFDLESTAPGPLLRKGSEVVELIKSGERFNVDSTDRYITFVSKYAAFDDGKAAARVLDHLSDVFE